MFKPLKLTALSLSLTAAPALFAESISNLQAGQLSEAGIADTETSLTISGEMNAADFAYIFDNLNKLQTLNIYNVDIVAYSGSSLPYTGMQTSPAATLPAYALTGLVNLTDVTLPQSITAIGKGALSGTGITDLYIPQGVTSVGDYAAMRCEQLVSIYIPSTVTAIGTRAFAYCPKLKTVEISGNLSYIPEGMFEACGGLKQLSLNSLAQCTEIGLWAVAECDGLNTLILPASSTAIAKGAMYGTSSIQTLALPEQLSYIGDNAMSAMTSLTNINATKAEEVPSLGENVWSRLDQSKVTLVTSSDLINDFKGADQWSNFNIISETDWENSTEAIASTVSSDELKIQIESDRIILTSSKALGAIAVFNVAGQRIVAANADHNAEISTRGWTAGIYLIVTEAGASKVSIK